MLLEDRKAQIFPALTPSQLQFALRFASGPARHFAAGEKVFDVGDRNTAVWLVVEVGIVATRRMVWEESRYSRLAARANSAAR
jgi:thioredoxin reductase (NADPH)